MPLLKQKVLFVPWGLPQFWVISGLKLKNGLFLEGGSRARLTWTLNITWLYVSTLLLLCLFFSATETRSIQCSSSLGQPGEEKEAEPRKPTFISFLLFWPPKSTFFASPLSVRPLPVPSTAMWQLWHTAAGLRLWLLVLRWLFQFEEGRVAAGRRVVNRTPIGGDQGHSGVLWVGFGIREGVRRAVAKVTVKQGVIQQLGCGPLFFQLRQRLGALLRPGLLLGGRAASVRRWHGAVGGRGCRRGRLCGDEAILCAGAIFEDGLQPGLLWLLDRRDLFDLQDNNEWFWIVLKKTFYKQYGIICDSYLNDLVVLLIGLFVFFRFLPPPPPPNDGLCLILFAAQVVSVGQAGTPHHFPVNTAVSSHAWEKKNLLSKTSKQRLDIF